MTYYMQDSAFGSSLISDILHGSLIQKCGKVRGIVDLEWFESAVLDSVSGVSLTEYMRKVDEAENERVLKSIVQEFSKKRWPAGTELLVFGLPDVSETAVSVTKQFHGKAGDRIAAETFALQEKKKLAKKVLVGIDSLLSIFKDGEKSGWDVAEHHQRDWFVYLKKTLHNIETGAFEAIVEIRRNSRNNGKLSAYATNVSGSHSYDYRLNRFKATVRFKNGALNITCENK